MLMIEARTHAGEGSTNEDAFLHISHPSSSSHCICVLADGQGGRAGGRRASWLACETVVQAASAMRPEQLSNPLVWGDLLRQADEALYACDEAGLTTLIALCVTPTHVCGASNGDSAALLMIEESAIHLTQHQSKNPPVGSGFASITPFGRKLGGPWQLLMVSDGVWKYVGWAHIKALMSTHDGFDAIEPMEQAARLPGNGAFPDDFTLMLIKPCV